MTPREAFNTLPPKSQEYWLRHDILRRIEQNLNIQYLPPAWETTLLKQILLPAIQELTT